MLSVPVYNVTGQKIGDESIDPALLGGDVNTRLLKQAVVMYHANRRQGTVKTKSRADVEGSSRKLYRQKGTGRARAGNLRTPVRKGGGHTFAKSPRDFSKAMPKKMRRLARNQAVLSKIQSADALIIDGVHFGAPKTKPFAQMLAAVHADGGCVFATKGVDPNAYKSGRNIPRTEVMNVADLNAWDVLRRKKLIFTRDAFAQFKATAAANAEAK